MIPIFFDIETTGLNPLQDRIVSLGFSKGYTKFIVIDESENNMIKEFLDFLNDHKDTAVLVGYNITNFDIPFLTTRALKHGFEEVAVIREIYRVDLMILVKRYLLTTNKYIKLKDICKFLGIEVKDEVSGAEIPNLWMEGNYDAIRKHCLSDLEITEKLFWKLKNLAVHNLRVRYGINVEIEGGFYESC